MVKIYMFASMWKNVEIMGLFFVKLSLMIRKDIGSWTSGVAKLRFITFIQIDLYLVTRRSWIYHVRLLYAAFNDGWEWFRCIIYKSLPQLEGEVFLW